jgi:glycerophosphoryl diester phosphodiesterase
MYPYVGKYIKDLTLAEIKTMDCGYLPGFPDQEQIRGFRMVELKDVLALVRTDHANHVRQIMADRGMRLPKPYVPR